METVSIYVDKLPSGGLSYKFNQIVIPKLTYSKIYSYKNDLDLCNNRLSRIMTQIQHLILDIPVGRELLFYDVIPVMIIRAYSSLDKSRLVSNRLSVKYECPLHKRIESLLVDLDSIDFNDIDPVLYKIKKIKLGNNKLLFRIPTVQQFMETVNKNKLKLKISDPFRYLLLLSCFKESDASPDEVLSLIVNAQGEDITSLDSLYNLLMDSFTHLNAKCSEGGSTNVTIESMDPLVDYFRYIPKYKGFNEVSVEY